MTRVNFKRVVQAVAVALLGMILAGCAEFPKNGAGQFTKLTFTVSLNGPISIQQQYIYGIVMYLAPGSSTPPQTVPANEVAPVLQQGSVNGMFTGLATNALVIPNVANFANPVSIYTFGSTAVNMGGLPLYGLSGSTNDQLPPPDLNGDIPGQLTFTVFLNQLQSVDAQSYQWIQFQVLTMNKTTLTSLSGRYMDALGVSPAFTATAWEPINQSTTYSMQTLYPEGLTGTTTPAGGDPALSIQSVTLNVQAP